MRELPVEGVCGHHHDLVRFGFEKPHGRSIHHRMWFERARLIDRNHPVELDAYTVLRPVFEKPLLTVG